VAGRRAGGWRDRRHGANLAAAAELAADKPSFGVQGFQLERDALDDLVERFADMSPEERGGVPGIKPERGDLILAGAVVGADGDGAGRLRRRSR
jgi:exopolyphosphatase/pppGpp-phosphohydrolase